MTPSTKKTRKVFKPLAIAALMVGGLLQPFMLPAFAAAGDTISNTATATYTDDDPNNVFTTESNTVTVTIKEVAGITVRPAGVIDSNQGSFEDNDTLFFDFRVTNVGNDTSDIILPGIDDIGVDNFDVTEVRVFSNDGTTSIGTYTATDPQSLIALDTTPVLTATGLEADDFIIVRVVGTVDGTGLNPGDDIVVTLGDTAPNNNDIILTQNQPFDQTASQSNVRTDDVDGAGAEILTDAEEKEASATQSVDFATQQTPLALAKVEKTDTGVDPGATGSANDDIITYTLSLTVEDTSPDGAFIPEALGKTLVSVDSSNIEVVLVSDAIPDLTQFNGTVTTVTGWTPVYTTDALSSSPVIANGATPTAWKRFNGTVPAGPFTLQGGDLNADVTRIGYIWEGAEIAEGTELLNAFTFDVITSGLPAAGGNIYNLAQVFGTTFDDADPLLEDPIAQIIYDESGDANPNNFNDNGTPPSETDGGDPDGSDFDPATDIGVADPENHGTDDGSNTGIGPDGEDNIVSLTGEELTGDDNILNGPDGRANAVGPTDDDDDYTNKGVDSDTTTATVEFTNTVANPSTNTSEIDNVTLEPISAAQAALSDDDAANDTSKYETTSIPDGTEITISYTDPVTSVTQTAVYVYSSGLPSTTDTPVNIGTLDPGDSVDYTVTVVFEDGDLIEDDVIKFPVIAFPDTGAAGYNGESVNNITLNKVYVGFMEVTKEVRVLDADGVTVLQDWGTALTNAESGNIIEYRITYTNTSPTLSGSGNVGLDAQNFRVIEDGDVRFETGGVDGDNNWDSDTTTPLTVHVTGVVVNSGTTVTYYNEFTEDGDDNNDVEIGTVDPATGSDVEAYVNEVGTVVPGGSGTMIFRRQIQ